jgi:hypothetical protein
VTTFAKSYEALLETLELRRAALAGKGGA